MPRVFVPAVLSGVLLWAAFFPLDLGFLGFVALVPWLSLVRADVSRRRRYLAAYAGGFVFSVLATKWVVVAHDMMYFSWLAFSLVLPLFWVLALDFIRRLDRLGLPLVLSVPVGWVALEYLRMHFPTGYPFLRPLGLQHMIGFGWYFLGYTQHAFLPLIQIADLGGVYAVSFLVAMVNGLLYHWWLVLSPNSPQEQRAVPRLTPSTLAVVALFAASVAYGYARLKHDDFAAGPRVAAIQGNVPQNEKIMRSGLLVTSYRALYQQAASEVPGPDLIIWPETCFPADWYEVAAGQTASEAFADDSRRCAAAFAKDRPAVPVLLGLNSLVWEDGRPWKYNSALLIDTAGRKIGRYDKMHLVPFGEYVPLGEVLPFMQVFTPYEKEYSCRPGSHWTRFPLTTADGRRFTFACLICYEDSDPSLGREYVASDPVDFLVNISNDGWFIGTEEHEQHLAICRFRAVETRRSVVRAVNTGISGVIDPDGRVVALPRETWPASKATEAVVSAVLPIDNRGSWYATLGDWVPGVCWLGVLAGFVAPRVRRA
jgi:apolipoprotein N-acyltransferase